VNRKGISYCEKAEGASVHRPDLDVGAPYEYLEKMTGQTPAERSERAPT
jgi:hypothetical protein